MSSDILPGDLIELRDFSIPGLLPRNVTAFLFYKRLESELAGQTGLVIKSSDKNIVAIFKGQKRIILADFEKKVS